MRLSEFLEIIKEPKSNILSNEDNYLKFLKVIAHNPNYNFMNQLSIFNKNPNAKLLKDFDFWRENNNSVRLGEKHIPIVMQDSDSHFYINKMFDINQTIASEKKTKEFLNQFNPFKSQLILDLELDALLDLSLPKFKKLNYNEDLIELFKLSLIYIFAERFNKEFWISKEILTANLKSLNINNIDDFGNILSSSVNYEIRRIQAIDDKNNQKSSQTIEYNNVNETQKTNNLTEEQEEYVHQERHSRSEKGAVGIGSGLSKNKSSVGKQRPTRSNEQSGFHSIDSRGRGDDQRQNNGYDGKRDDGTGSESLLRRYETELSLLSETAVNEGIIRGKGVDRSSSRDTSESSGLHRPRETENDGVLGANGANETKRARRIQRSDEQPSLFFEGDSNQRDSRELKSEQKSISNNVGDRASTRQKHKSKETQEQELQISLFNEQSTNSNKESKKVEIVDEIKPNLNAKNYVIQNYEEPTKFDKSEKVANNINAIKTLLEIEKENRLATSDEQNILAKYIGWGGLSDVFEENRKTTEYFNDARDFLKENLSKEEYKQARESTLTSFYTSKPIIDSIYTVLEDSGFKGGNILEPSMGTGNFIGNMPKNIADNSKVYGVELDSLSGRISKQLYPNSNIQIKGFEETDFSNNFFDVVVGNIPFGDFKVYDKEYLKNDFLIHDYFIAKSLDKVRNGGILALITSSGTLDKKDNKFRKYLASRARLLGALRLPNTAFKNSSGTEVVADILFLQKLDGVRDREEDWIYLGKDNFTEEEYINNYFIFNPRNILGNLEKVSGRFGDTLTCHPFNDGRTLEELLLNKTKSKLWNYDLYSIPKIEATLEDSIIKTIPATDNVKNYSYTIIDDEIYYRENSVLIKKELSKKQADVIKEYLKVYETLTKVIEYQKNNYDDEKIKSAQNELNKNYDNFSKKYGFINHKNIIPYIRDDSNFPLMSSLEILDDKNRFIAKADIFTKKTIRTKQIIEHVDTAVEALILSNSEYGKVYFPFMEKITGKSKDNLIEELEKDNEIFLSITPETVDYYLKNKLDFLDISKTGTYLTKDEFLTGNLVKKLDTYKIIESEINKSLDKDILSNEDRERLIFEKNKISKIKESLIEVFPKKIHSNEISIKLGATWIPPKYVAEFCQFLIPGNLPNIIYLEDSSIWNIDSKKYLSSMSEIESSSTYGTQRINAYDLIELALNLREPKIFDNVIDGNGNVTRELNKKETFVAIEKQQIIKEKFKDWIFEDYDRRLVLENIYNSKFNSIRNREYNGDNLNLIGISEQINLKKHQKDAIARVLYGGNTLLAHVVGAGKTFEMVASAMESKRLGLATKSLFVVPNHLTMQLSREFMQLYPTANILVSDKKDFEKANRKRFISRIATGEYDAVIIGHTQFERIPMSLEYRVKHIRDQIDEIAIFLEKLKREREQSFSVKEYEKLSKKLSAKLNSLNAENRKDDVISFEELGVDRLFIDEAHYYKNLFTYTKMINVAGIGKTEAMKSSDMYMKCMYMDKKTQGKGIIFATGTPISNSMSELYTMQKYLQNSALEERGIKNFDDWASTFGETITALELAPEGTGYRMKTRFSKFYNLPELMTMFKEVADIKTADMLDLDTPKANYITIKTMPSATQKEILEGFIDRAKKVRNREVKPNEDNMLLITNDGKKLALDQRLINPMFKDEENSKVNKCVSNVYDIWKKTKEQKSTQLIFCDLSTPRKGTFNVYDDIKTKLINKGISENEIAFIHDVNTDKQKDTLFAKVRSGEIRVLLGSTQKMGAGTNVQKKLVAMHDLDVPWRPSDLEQRSGRIIRQGNENKEVNIYRYITENTFDAYLWQTIENKQKFISQIMTSKTPVRVAEDVDEATLNYSEIKALATGNPKIKEKMDLDNQIAKLKMLEVNYKSTRFDLERKIKRILPSEIEMLEKRIDAYSKDLKKIGAKPNEENFVIQILDKTYYNKKSGGLALIEALKKVTTKQAIIGKYRNLDLTANLNPITKEFDFIMRGESAYEGSFGVDVFGNIQRIDNVLDKISTNLNNSKNLLVNKKNQIEKSKIELQKPFERAEELKEKNIRLAKLNAELKLEELDDKENEQKQEQEQEKQEQEQEEAQPKSKLPPIRAKNKTKDNEFER